jgi:hypothetical protein
MVDDRLATRGYRPVLVEQERAISFADEEAGRDRFYPRLRGIQ